MNQNRNKSVTFLLVFFIWAAGKDLDSIVRFSLTTDYAVFVVNNLGWLFFALSFVVLSLNVMTVYQLFKPQRIGFPIAISAVAASAVQGMLVLILAQNHLPEVRSALEASRVARGLSASEGALDAVLSAPAMLLSALLALAFYFVVSFLLFRNKHYFDCA